MLKFSLGVFIILHGLVHLWYVVLSQGLVEFQPEMGWSARSWLFTDLLGDATTRSLASVLFVLTTVGFVIAGAGILLGRDWWRPLLLGAALLSTAILLVLWDGSTQFIVEKGLIGLLINVVLIALMLVGQGRFLPGP